MDSAAALVPVGSGVGVAVLLVRRYVGMLVVSAAALVLVGSADDTTLPVGSAAALLLVGSAAAPLLVGSVAAPVGEASAINSKSTPMLPPRHRQMEPRV